MLQMVLLLLVLLLSARLDELCACSRFLDESAPLPPPPQVPHVSVPGHLHGPETHLKELADLLGNVEHVDFKTHAAFDAAWWEPGAEEGHNRLSEHAERLWEAREAAEEGCPATRPTEGAAGRAKREAEDKWGSLAISNEEVAAQPALLGQLAPMARHVKRLELICFKPLGDAEACPLMSAAHVDALGSVFGAHLCGLRMGVVDGFAVAEGMDSVAMWERLLLALPCLTSLDLLVRLEQLGGQWLRQLVGACKGLGRRLSLELSFAFPRPYNSGGSVKERRDVWVKEAQATAESLADASGGLMQVQVNIPNESALELREISGQPW